MPIGLIEGKQRDRARSRDVVLRRVLEQEMSGARSSEQIGVALQ